MFFFNCLPKKYPLFLMASTALVAIALAVPKVVYAVDVTVTTATTAKKIMTNGQTLTVTATGSITANPAVTIPTNITANKLLNSGAIDGSYGLYIYNGGDISQGLNNSGTLKGNSFSIYLRNGADIAGGIDNTGLIAGKSNSSTGINVYLNSDISGGVINQSTGAISGGNYGILVNRANISGGIHNSGTIHSKNRYGIYVYNNSNVAGGIENDGVINGGQYGTFVYKSDVSGGVNNTSGGTIKGNYGGISAYQSADISGGIKNDGILSGGHYGAYVYRSNISGGFVNNGTTQGGQYGVYVRTGDISGGIANKSGGIINGGNYGAYVYRSTLSGGLLNEAGGTLAGGDIGVYLNYNANIAGGIDNKGAITGGDYGIYIYRGTSNISGGLINETSGIINGGNYGVYIRSAHLSGGIANSGTISGNNAGIYVYKGDISGGITNNQGGTIEGGGTGPAIKLTSIKTATPININGGRIIGDVTDNATTKGFSPVTIGGNFKTEGNFTVSSLAVNTDKMLTISSGDTFTVNHMNPSTGGIAFMVTSHNTGGTGKLIVNGAGKGLDLSGLKISIDAAHNPILTKGDTLLIGDGKVAIAGGPSTTPKTVADNSFLWNFQIVDGSYGTIGGDNTQLYLLTDLQPSTGRHATLESLFKNLIGTTDPQLSQIISNLGATSTAAGYDSILSSVQPDVSGASYQAAQGALNKSLGLVTQRLNGTASPTGLSSGNTLSTSDLQGWIQGFGGHAVQGMRNNVAGYRANTGGMMLGLDTGEHYDSCKLGLAASYAHTSSATHDANRTQSNINSYQMTAYGEWDLAPHTYIRGMAAYARSHTDATRHDVGGVSGLNAYGTFNANQYTARVIAGRGYAVSQALTLTPQIMANFMHYDPQDYTETGAGGANLSVTQKSLNMAELGLGLNATWAFELPSGTFLSPSLQAGYRYDLVGDSLATTSAFTGSGAVFSSSGARPAQSRFNLSPQISWQSQSGWQVVAGYTADYRQDYIDQSGFLRLKVHF